MHTLVILLAGLILLGVFVLLGHALGDGSLAALYFLPAWLACAGFNLWYGVAKAGYSVRDESPIFLLLFIIPAAAAVLCWWKLRAN